MLTKRKNLYLITILISLISLAGCENKELIAELDAANQQNKELTTELESVQEKNDNLLSQITTLNAEIEKYKTAEQQRKEAARLAALDVRIEDDCSINGNGTVSCTFKNSGTGEGSICVKPYLARIYTGDDAKTKYKDYGLYGDSKEISSNGEICSGLVRGGDVTERKKFLTFALTSCEGSECFYTPSPSDFCSQRNDYSSWYAGCNFGTREVKN